MKLKKVRNLVSAAAIAALVGTSTIGVAAADVTYDGRSEEIAVEAETVSEEEVEETTDGTAENTESDSIDDESAEVTAEDTESDADETEVQEDENADTAEEDETDADDSEGESDGYVYAYAGLTWNEFWASEGVYAAGNASSSDELDDKNETDKGGFDAVSRATANHGLHRGSFQSMATIYDEAGNTYEVSHWSADGKTIFLTDGTSIGWGRGTITKADGTTAQMSSYQVTGIKYVPVAVPQEDFEQFATQYRVVKSEETLVGGYSEMKLTAYEKTAAVTADTNGLKYATKNADGSFSFSARKNGTDSGLAGESLKTASAIEMTVKPASGAYGEFLRVDLNGDGYGALGSAMYAVKWTYYGDQSEDAADRQPLATYGTKFAADNWMHKAMGIQLGLTDSVRCQLPAGTDGTGYWALTVYAMGYEDYTVNFQATADNIVMPEPEVVDAEALKAAVASAEALDESEYTAASWATMKLELDEAKEAVETASTQAIVDEALEHLNAAVEALVQKNIPKIVLKAKNVTYNGKVQKIGTAKVTGSTAKVTYKYYSDSKLKKAVAASKVKNAGTYYVRASVAATDDAKAAVSNTVKLTIKKAAATIKTKTTTKTYKTATLKKKAQTFTIGALANSKGKIKYTVTKKNSKVSVSSAGKVTVKKGTKKGTYKVTVKITSASTTNYNAATKTVTVKVVVK